MLGLDVVVNGIDKWAGWVLVTAVAGTTVYAVIRGIRVEIKHSFKDDEDE